MQKQPQGTTKTSSQKPVTKSVSSSVKTSVGSSNSLSSQKRVSNGSVQTTSKNSSAAAPNKKSIPNGDSKPSTIKKAPTSSTIATNKNKQIEKQSETPVIVPIKIQDHEVNEEATKQVQNDDLYQKFIKWFENNGGIAKGIEYPVIYGNSGYMGIGASENLPPNTAFLSVPKKLIICTQAIDNHEQLGQIVEDYPDFFDSDENEDGDFNKLALFLMFESIKKEKSFWKPYLDVCQNPNTILQWDNVEIQEFQDQSLVQQAKEYTDELELTWDKFDIILSQYPEVFPTGTVTKGLFLWAFEVVMTRCFGNTLPGSYLIPFGDFMNHNKRGATYFIVNKRFEENPQKAPSDYTCKKNSVDMRIVGVEQDENDVKDNIYFEDELINYLDNYKTKLSFPIDIEEVKYKPKEDIIEYVREINFDRVKFSEQEQIWNQPYFSTSEEEDNDSDSEDESLKKNSEFKKIKQREIGEIQQKIKSKEEDYSQEEQKNIQTIQTVQMDKIKVQEKKKETKYLEDLQDDEFDWYDYEDQDNYITFFTQHPLQKKQQIYNCYGRRTNKFLMLWYGFCFANNAYDSFSFRLLQSWETQPIKEYQIFTEYISYKDWDDDKYVYKGTTYKTDSFTKEFKLKKSGLCEDFMTFLRVKILKTYKESDYFDINITMPSSLKFELQVLELAQSFFIQLQNQKQSTTIEQDSELLKQANIPWKRRFAIVYRKEQKEILKMNVKLVGTAIKIIQELLKGIKTIKQAYLQKYPEYDENENDYKVSREKLRDYLRQLYIGVILNKK